MPISDKLSFTGNTAFSFFCVLTDESNGTQGGEIGGVTGSPLPSFTTAVMIWSRTSREVYLPSL